ncbi:MAG: RNA polymerase recycling motor HelD [Oscillospiraceae bacterium]
MPLKEHPDNQYEEKRLERTIECVITAIEKTSNTTDLLKEDTKVAFSENDQRDNNTNYDRIALNAALYGLAKDEYAGLLHARNKPYFCRIDFIPDERTQVKEIYIGKTSLTGDDIENPLIVDWRAPVASVYYDGRIGHVTYPVLNATRGGELLLKRQYSISAGKLEGFMDVDITANDAFLQSALGENKDNRLKDIVTTIQAEQNDIIRANIRYPLIVQGAAGSGKTTIALHRIAYLIYTYQKNFYPDNFLIIAPNSLFLNYISDVLPELGVERVRQTTFVDLAIQITGINYKLTSLYDKLTRFISQTDEADNRQISLMKRVCAFKGSMEFRDILSGYVQTVIENFIPDQDFMLKQHILYTASEMKSIFLNHLKHLPPYRRVDQLKKTMNTRLKTKRDLLIKQVEGEYANRIFQIRNMEESSDERRKIILALIDEREQKIESIKKSSRMAVRKYLSFLPKQTLLSYFTTLMTDKENGDLLYGGSMDKEFITYFCEYNTNLLAKKILEFEDLAALMYLKYSLFGLDEQMDIKYMVIDEAQDFSLFQLYVLKYIFNIELFTILGDLAQGIHSYRGINNWKDVTEHIFPRGNCRYLTLQQSYRTTIEIMNAANEVLMTHPIAGLLPANPVVRHGDKPVVYRCIHEDKQIALLESKIREHQASDYKTIAIICKTDDECKKIKELLAPDMMQEIKLLGAEDLSYEGGTIILPSYLAKGLEFDAVIICVFDEDYRSNSLDTKLLYVGMTRALHRLDIICNKEGMELLQQTTSDAFHQPVIIE